MSLFGRARFRRDDDGYLLRLPAPERLLLASLPEQLTSVLGEIAQGGAIPDEFRRLFPVAYAVDETAEAGYVAHHRDGLLEERREALEVLARSAENDHLSDEEADQWLGAINSLRLAIGTRLDVSEEVPELDQSDPEFAEWICYQYLSFIESELIEAMSGSLQAPIPGAGDDLPDDPWGDPPGGLRWDGTPTPEGPSA